MRCGSCGSTTIEYVSESGTSVCVGCGNVVEENAIVSEVTFGETGSGAAMVQGSFVGAGSSTSCPVRRKWRDTHQHYPQLAHAWATRLAKEHRSNPVNRRLKAVCKPCAFSRPCLEELNKCAAGRQKIRQVAHVLNLSESMQEKAQRFFTLALTTNFVRGRRSMQVVAVCLYVGCRQSQTTHMLIDFSDALGVSTSLTRSRSELTPYRSMSSVLDVSILTSCASSTFSSP